MWEVIGLIEIFRFSFLHLEGLKNQTSFFSSHFAVPSIPGLGIGKGGTLHYCARRRAQGSCQPLSPGVVVYVHCQAFQF